MEEPKLKFCIGSNGKNAKLQIIERTFSELALICSKVMQAPKNGVHFTRGETVLTKGLGRN